ncbi:tyrosine-type recombinase/integrase [Psychrobacter pacificensis]|uniref:tyrosine-type recombinase/integrase n=1 Tax=Psychrobacter pacificensis TaxID=112002 RepID=UPI001CBE78C4|nr:tyrosine-type recombinase/integrase [Psychrobacter pacificensis]MBZ1392673.1 tyrosine-type recombinase/integrase [Psychrobacter pacificensis]
MKIKTDLTTDTQIKRAIKDTIKAGKTISYPIAGYKGLEVRIRPHKDSPDAAADFRHRYTHPITGKRPYMTLGQYPALSLTDARQYHSDNMQLLAKDIDPIEHRADAKQKDIADRQNILNYFINEWSEIQKSKDLSKSTIKNNKVILKPIQQKLGHMKVTDISSSVVIKFITDIQKTSPVKGLQVKSLLKSILQIAKAHMVIEYNPASDLRGTLKAHKPNHYPSLTQPKEFAELLKDIDQLDDENQLYNKCILQLLALTFVRVGDICAMQWTDINWLKKQWELKPQKAGNRADMVASMVIPLAPQVIAILEQMKALTGNADYVFHNTRRKAARYHNTEEVNKLLNSSIMNSGQSYKGIHSPHGFRSSAKTMLMERLGYDELITELALGHRMLNAYGTAYNRMTGLEQRAAMMSDWANYLDNIKAGKFDNVIHANFKQLKEQKLG